MKHVLSSMRRKPQSHKGLRMLLQFAGEDQPIIPLTNEERVALDISKVAAARGEFARDEQVRAIWAQHGL